MAGDWNEMIFKVFSNWNHSMIDSLILWFCDSVAAFYSVQGTRCHWLQMLCKPDDWFDDALSTLICRTLKHSGNSFIQDIPQVLSLVAIHLLTPAGAFLISPSDNRSAGCHPILLLQIWKTGKCWQLHLALRVMMYFEKMRLQKPRAGNTPKRVCNAPVCNLNPLWSSITSAWT